MLFGCSNDELTFSEISLKKVNANVERFIHAVNAPENDKGNGIFIFNDSDHVNYLFVNEDFLEDGNGFGGLDIKTDDNSVKLYLTDDAEATDLTETYKIYKIKLDRKYDYMRVFKNGEETYFETSGG